MKSTPERITVVPWIMSAVLGAHVMAPCAAARMGSVVSRSVGCSGLRLGGR